MKKRLPSRREVVDSVVTPEVAGPVIAAPTADTEQDNVMSRFLEGLAIAEQLPTYESYPQDVNTLDTRVDGNSIDAVEPVQKKKLLKTFEQPFYGHDYRTKNKSNAVTSTQPKEEMWSHDKFGIFDEDDDVSRPKVSKNRTKKPQAASATTSRPPLDIQKKYSQESKHHRSSDPAVTPSITNMKAEDPIRIKRTPKFAKQATARRESLKSIRDDPAIHTVSEQPSSENYTSRNKHYSLEQPYVDQTTYYPPRSTDSPSMQASSNNSYSSPYQNYGHQPMISSTGQIVIMGQDGYMYPATPATMMNFGFTPLSSMSSTPQDSHQYQYTNNNMQNQQQQQVRQPIVRKAPVLVRITSSDGKIINPTK